MGPGGVGPNQVARVLRVLLLCLLCCRNLYACGSGEEPHVCARRASDWPTMTYIHEPSSSTGNVQHAYMHVHTPWYVTTPCEEISDSDDN